MNDTTITPEEKAELLSPDGRKQLCILLEKYLQHPKLRLLKEGFRCYIDALETAEAALHKEEVYSEELESQLQHTNAENARLQKMVEWLAGRCAEHCEDKGPNPRCSVAVCTIIHCNKATAEEWAEAARRGAAEKGE